MFEGFYLEVLLQYLNVATLDRCMFMVDTFSGLAEDYSTEHERATVGYGLKDLAQWYAEICARFEP